MSVAGEEGSVTPIAPTAELEVIQDDRVVATIDRDQAARLAEGRGALPVESREVVRRGNARLVEVVDEGALRAELGRIGETESQIVVPERTISSRINTPIVQQVYTNNCETAALSMLLASVGIEKDQLELQEQVDVDGPLDPETGPDGEMVWGDPEFGFVGRPEGGGTAGGYGVFAPPVVELAERFVPASDLSESSPREIYQRLLEGDAVMVWIGLTDGPYETWTSPRGEEVTVNYGEHTVVLTGIRPDGTLSVNDPLDGLRKVWTKDEFVAKWDLLERRAVALDAPDAA